VKPLFPSALGLSAQAPACETNAAALHPCQVAWNIMGLGIGRCIGWGLQCLHWFGTVVAPPGGNLVTYRAVLDSGPLKCLGAFVLICSLLVSRCAGWYIDNATILGHGVLHSPGASWVQGGGSLCVGNPAITYNPSGIWKCSWVSCSRLPSIAFCLKK